MHQHQHVPIPLERLADVPQPVVVLLEKLLEKDPRQRFQNPTELLKAIPVITDALGARRKISRRSILTTPPSPLTPLSRGQRSPKFLLPLLLLLALLAGISVGAWYLLKPKSSINLAGRVPLVAPSPTVVQTSEVTPTLSPVNVVLRLHGSNTIGSKLIAALFRGFLSQEGWSNITRVSGKGAEEYSLEGVISGISAVQSVQIEARGSATAFDSLAKAACDIGMASRKIKPAEQAALTALGNMTSPACEHVLALDGIAVVVSKSNAVASLSRRQIEAIFSGQTTDWSQVGGRPGPIAVYARDDKSGTYDTFKSLVLESAPLSPTAKRFEDSGALSDAVATDPNGIGFIGLPFVRSARPVPVFDEGTAPLLPSAFTVAREDYVLSRRLFLYTPANPPNRLTLRFIQFATSNAGQEIVAQEGFVNQIVKKEDPNLAGPVALPSPANLPPEYAWLTVNAACLNVNFRFRTGGKELDNKALDDLDRVTTYLASPVARGKQVLLIGFADNKGSPKFNLELSIERAKIVAHQFASRGVLAETSTGFGSAVPVASNETDEGREKNRRVEVWMK
jgi:phosphate transport system substrate-binding protein